MQMILGKCQNMIKECIIISELVFYSWTIFHPILQDHKNNQSIPIIFLVLPQTTLTQRNMNISTGPTADFMSISLIAGIADRLVAAE